MSEAIHESSADMLKAKAAEWLERRDREDWGRGDQDALNAWLEESLANSVAYWRLEAGWARTERLAVLRGGTRQEPFDRGEKRWPRVLRIVAALGFVTALTAVGANYALRTHEKYYATSVGGHEIVTLEDGSSIELNTDTALRVSREGKTRLVTLDRGEAYFQISHNPEHPFVVNVASHRVIDLGTKFLMRSEAGRIEVALYEGRASFESTDGQKRKAMLSSGDVAVVTQTDMTVTNEPAHTLINELAWQRGFLVLDHTALGDAARDLNRYNRQKIVIVDPNVARMQMYGTIPINGVDGFIRVAQDVLRLNVIKRGDEIVISR